MNSAGSEDASIKKAERCDMQRSAFEMLGVQATASPPPSRRPIKKLPRPSRDSSTPPPIIPPDLANDAGVRSCSRIRIFSMSARGKLCFTRDFSSESRPEILLITSPLMEPTLSAPSGIEPIVLKVSVLTRTAGEPVEGSADSSSKSGCCVE